MTDDESKLHELVKELKRLEQELRSANGGKRTISRKCEAKEHSGDEFGCAWSQCKCVCHLWNRPI